MMEKYKENNINKDIFYEEQKREKVKAAKEEAMKKKKEKMEEERAAQKAKELEDVKEDVEEPEEEVEVIEEKVGSEPEPELDTNPNLSGGKIDEDLQKSLDDVDPWMANKLKEKGE